jgi:zinc/manganese transport system permease protein
MIWDVFVSPFVEYNFMQKALLSCLFLSFSAVPLGVFLLLRGLSLVGDSLSHGILPGIALAAIFYGLAPIPLFIGGIIAGLIVAFFANILSEKSIIPEDASFTFLYSISLALGVIILYYHGANVNILHLLFGSVLGIENQAFLLIVAICLVTTFFLCKYRKHLLMLCFDPLLFQVAKKNYKPLMFIFLSLVVANLVASYQAIGTLLALGLMMLPAISARLLCNHYRNLFLVSQLLGCLGCYMGLLLSYHADLPSGPSIIICLSCQCVLAFLFKSELWKRVSS